MRIKWGNRHQESKTAFYAKNFLVSMTPRLLYQKRRTQLLQLLQTVDMQTILHRLNYYNKLTSPFERNDTFLAIENFSYRKPSVYYFDLNYPLKYFPQGFQFAYEFGDVITVPDVPTLVKSRPIEGENQNSVVMKLEKHRHFLFVNDRIPFARKKEMAVWRGAAYQQHRKDFIEKMKDSDLCDIGQTNNPPEDVPWQKEFMSIDQQLQYKFIISIEGNDVASNLKWVMSSNSLCMMTTPKYETWYLEGELIPDHHYVHLEDDYSNLEEKIRYYSSHPQEAEAIIRNAQAYAKSFQNPQLEELLQVLVLEKYFHLSGQLDSPVSELLNLTRAAA